jgi:hypothetical protein
MPSRPTIKSFLVSISLLVPTAETWAQNDPCLNYYVALAYSRTKDPTPATLVLIEPKTGAEIEMRLPRNFTGIQGNLTDGIQCKIALEMLWPQMTAGGLVADNDKRVQDRLIGDMPRWRSLTIDVGLDRSPWGPWMTPNRYCRERRQLGELPDRPFGLRALDDGRPWPRHRQSDGSYQSMKELLSYPRNSANVFYFIDDDPEQMIRIYCSKGAPRCQLEDHFNGFQTTTFIDGNDLANWRTYRDAVRKFLAEHTVRVVPPRVTVDYSQHVGPPGALSACAWDMEQSIGADTLRAMGFR